MRCLSVYGRIKQGNAVLLQNYYRTGEKKKSAKIPSIKRIKSWIPLINEECDYKGDGNF
jgi:hypothetical protein